MTKKTVDARTSLFGRMAMESGLVTYEDIVACIEEQDRTRAEGGTPPKLGELLVEKGILNQGQVEMILKMQANPASLMGRLLVEGKLVTREQLREVLDEQIEFQRLGQTPPKLGQILVRKGWVTDAQIQSMLKKKEVPANYLGEFLVQNKLVKQSDIDKILADQKVAVERGQKPKRLGELLVETGVLRQEEMDLYSHRHIQGRRMRTSSVTEVRRIKNAASKVVRGDFQIIKTLGQHLDGITYQSQHVPSGAVVTTHFFNDPELAGVAVPEKDTEAFNKKCDQVQLIKHPASQKVFSAEVIQGKRVLVAEFVAGVTLGEIIGNQGKIDWKWAMEIAFDLASVLLEAEGLGINHDDIRPSSILVDSAGKTKLALWAYTEMPQANRDLLAKHQSSVSYYFSPERLTGPASKHCDMFSLGLTLIHAVTGKSGMVGASFAEAAAGYSPAIVMQNLALDMSLPLPFLSILSRMIELDPAKRHESYRALVSALEAVKDDQGLEFVGGYASAAVTTSMTPEEASTNIAAYLQSEEETVDAGRVSIFKLIKYYSLPLLVMVAAMIVTTIVYRTTQASQGLMVRANWRDLQGDKAGALTLYSMISEIYPKNPTVQQRYYDLALEMKDHSEAEVALERLMNLRPERRIEYLETQADLRVWQSRFQSAVDLYREVAIQRPNDVKLKLKIANALLWGNNNEEAQQEFSDLVFLDPNNTAYILGLARSAAANKDYDTASRMFDRLNRSSTLPENVLMEYAWSLRDSNRTAELTSLTKSVIGNPEIESYSKRNQTYLYYWAGDYPNASRLLGDLAQVSPNDKEFLTFRISINDQFGNTDALIEDYRALAALEPNNAKTYLTLARLQQRKSDFVAADEYFRKLLSLNPEDIDTKAAIAENYVFMGKHTDAIRWYREVLAKRPNDNAIIKGMVQAMIWNGEYTDALEYVERLYRENPNDRWNRVNLISVYTRIGKSEEAQPIVKKLIEEGLLTLEEKEMLAVNAVAAGDNQLLLQLVGAQDVESGKLDEIRLILARRFRAQERHALSLPLYAAVLANAKNPEPKFLIECAETAKWAKRPDIATKWLDMAREIVAARAGTPASATPTPVLPAARMRLSTQEWDEVLSPLKTSPDVYEYLSGFKKRYSLDGVKAGTK